MIGTTAQIRFRIYKGNTFLREEVMTHPVIKIGKLSTSQLRLDDDSVSRMHAVVEATSAGDISIIDLGSTRGTWVNGQKVSKARLSSGDRIALGDIQLEVMIGNDRTAAPASMTRIPGTAQPARMPQGTPPPSPVVQAATRTPVTPPAPPVRLAKPEIQPAAQPAFQPERTLVAASTGFATEATDPETSGNARAIEIAAMLGDSVMDVKHLSNPRGGRVTSTTYGLLAGGALMLILAAVAFGMGLQNASFNKASRAAWEASGRPVHEWRPRRLGLGYDWMAFGGALTGILALTTGLVRMRSERESPVFRIGSDPGVEFPLSEAPASSFALVAPRGDDFVCNVPANAVGELSVDGRITAIAQLAAQGLARPSISAANALELSIPPRARIKVHLGQSTFLISSVARPRRHVAPLLGTLDRRPLTYLAGAAVVHLGFLGILHNIPPAPRALALDSSKDEARMIHVTSKPSEEAKQPEEPADSQEQGTAGGSGTSMALPSGTMGSQESQRQAGRYQLENRNLPPQLARAESMAQARQAGVLGVLQMQGSSFAALTGTGDIASGLDDYTVAGGLIGDEAGAMHGGFGFARSGFGPGGNGTGWGTIGTGHYGTIGHGPGTGPGFDGLGTSRGGLPKRTGIVPQVKINSPITYGNLDKNIIRRYIRRQLPRIKHCYERELVVKPSIAGDVITEFQISPQGTVLASKAAGVDDKVSSCVAEVIKTVVFPKPQGGDLVQVKYPFTFRPTGG